MLPLLILILNPLLFQTQEPLLHTQVLELVAHQMIKELYWMILLKIEYGGEKLIFPYPQNLTKHVKISQSITLILDLDYML